jgi:hypothetical protein
MSNRIAPSPLYVVIATAGRPDLIGRTLESLAACRKPEGYTGALVVENGPQMGAEEIVRAASPELRARYLHTEQANKSAALNLGIAEVGDGLVVFFDDDVRFDADVLVAYARAAMAQGRGAYFGGTCRVDYEEDPPAYLLRSLPTSARGLDPRTSQAGFYMGFNWAAYAADLAGLGGFDSSLGPGSPVGATTGDETDMQVRLQKAGVRPVPVPEAIVWHYVPRERCSEEWVVRRGFKEGMAHAHLDWDTRPHGGVLRSVLSLGVNGMRLARAIISKDEGKRVEALGRIYFRSGFLRGSFTRQHPRSLQGASE